jgi:protein-tyrosine phosphatase
MRLTRGFGTLRGLVRTVLADVMWRCGPYRKYGRIDWARVQRLVFVCRGNICRSPFAHRLAQANVTAFPIVSVGLVANTGHNACELAIEVAREFSVDLTAHRTTNVSDFEILDGDLLLLMEDRHISALRPYMRGRDVQVALLGLWCRPRFALLYDPHTLSRDYFVTCFNRIDRAVRGLAAEIEGLSPDVRKAFPGL